MNQVSLSQLAFTAFTTPVVNQTNSAGDAFVNALNTAKDNSMSSNNTNQYSNQSNNNTQSTSKKDEVKPKEEVTKKETSSSNNTEKTTQPTTTKETAKKTEKPQKAMTEEEAVAMVANLLQIPIPQLEEALVELNINVEDLLSDSTAIDELISKIYTFEDLVTNPELTENIIDLKEFVEETKVVLKEVEDLPVVLEEIDFENVIKADVDEEAVKPTKDNEQDMLMQQNMVEKADVEEDASPRQQQNSDLNYNQFIQTAATQTTTTKADGLNTFDMNMHLDMVNQNLKQQAAQATQTSATAMTHRPVMTQLLDKIQIVNLKDGTQITIDLDPQDLGKLSLRIIETGGVIKGDITVENDKVKQLVENQLESLKQALAEKGITVSEFSVDVRDQSFNQQMNHSKNKSQKRINELLETYMSEEEIAEEAIESEIDITQLKHEQNVNVKV